MFEEFRGRSVTEARRRARSGVFNKYSTKFNGNNENLFETSGNLRTHIKSIKLKSAAAAAHTNVRKLSVDIRAFDFKIDVSAQSPQLDY